MKYEDLIRKIFKKYKSKRELKKELEQLFERYITQKPVKIIRETYDVIPIECKYKIDKNNIIFSNELEKNEIFKRAKYSIEKEIFDYLIDENIINFKEQVNQYENAVELIGFMKAVRIKRGGINEIVNQQENTRIKPTIRNNSVYMH